MINQHLQTATVPTRVATAMLQETDVLNAIAELQEFIDLRPNAREVRKALGVKLVYQGYLHIRGNSDNFRCIVRVDNRLEASL